MLLTSDKSDFDKAIIVTLRKRFQPADIHSLEFHHRMQGDETSIQQLGLKVFPSTIVGKEFDQLIIERFYQALQVKWQ